MTVKKPYTACPWCHQRPPLFEHPEGRPGDAGDPVLCPLCGRWSMLQLPEGTLVRANTEMRAIIRLNPNAQKVREAWRQRVLKGKKEAG